MRMGIRFRQTAYTFLVTLAISILIITFTIFDKKKIFVDEFLLKGQGLSMLLSESLVSPLYELKVDRMSGLMTHALHDEDIDRAFVIDVDGYILSDGTEENELMYERITVVYEFLSGKETLDRSRVLGDNRSLLVVKSVETISGEVLGAVVLEISLLRANQLASQALNKLLLIAIAAMTIGFGLSVWVAGRQIKPIEKMRKATECIANGDLSIRLNSARNDELGELANAVDKMTEQLQTTTVSKSYMNRIIESMQDGLLILDEGKGITKVNRYLTRLFSTSDEMLMGKPFSSLFRKVDEKGGYDLEDTIAEGDIDVTDGDYVIQVGGDLIPVNIATSMLEDIDGTNYKLAIVRDIRLEQDLKNMHRLAKDKAEEASRAKSSFLANMSHEIRTPLNAIVNMTFLCMQTELKLKQRNYIEKVHASANLLQKIVTDILDFSKIEAGRLSIEKVDFTTDSMLSQLAMLAGPLASRKNIHLAFDVQEGVPLAFIGDPLRIGQVLLNLVSNAIKFTEKGYVSVTIRTKKKKEDAIALEMCVEDTGIGIKKSAQESLFSSFTQADESITRHFGGTGLGLVICRELARLMGGDIGLMSEEGVGTKVYFDVTLATSGSQEKPANLLIDKKLLLIGTDTKSTTAIYNTLTTFDMCVTHKYSVEGVVETLEDYDFILIDCTFDAIFTEDSVALLFEQIGSILENENKVFLLSTSEKTSEKFAKYSTSYIQKPIFITRLVEAIYGLNAEGGVSDSDRESFTALASIVNEQLSGKRILLAEDNEVNQEIVIDLLAHSGAEIITAANGKEVLECLEREEVDLVLMDVQMPVMDGITATKSIREEKGWRHIPIIALTASAMAGDRELCVEIGMNDYLTKPIVPKELFLTLIKWLDVKSINIVNIDEKKYPVIPEVRNAQDPLCFGTIQGISLEAGLSTCNGKVKLLEKLIEQFARKFGSFDMDLKHAIDAKDYLLARSMTHNLKGVAANIGALRVSRLAGDLNEALLMKDAYIDQEVLEMLCEELQGVIKSVEHQRKLQR